MKVTLTRKEILFLLMGTGLVGLGLAFRLLPTLPNFTPLAAIALFSGVYFRRCPALALLIPIAILSISDLFLGFYPGFLFVYGGFALCVFLGRQMIRRLSFAPVFGATLTGATGFFLVSNLGVFLSTPLYAKSWNGLLQCYLAAIPFFRTSLVADLLFSAALFASLAFVRRSMPALASSTSPYALEA